MVNPADLTWLFPSCCQVRKIRHCLRGGRMPDICADSFSWSVCYALAAPADVYLALAVLHAYEQAVDNGHRNVELVEYLGLLLDLAALDELV